MVTPLTHMSQTSQCWLSLKLLDPPGLQGLLLLPVVPTDAAFFPAKVLPSVKSTKRCSVTQLSTGSPTLTGPEEHSGLHDAGAED